MRWMVLLLVLLAIGSASAEDPAPGAASTATEFSLPKGRFLCSLAPSADGKWVAAGSAVLGKDGARSDGRLHLFSITGGDPITVAATGFTGELTFSSDSQWIVASRRRTRAVEARRLGDLARSVRIDVSKATSKASAAEMIFKRVAPTGGSRIVLVGWSFDDPEERLAEHQLRRVFDLGAGKAVEDLAGRSGDYDWCPSPDGALAAVAIERGIELRRASGDVAWTVRTGGYCDGTVFSRDGTVIATHDRGMLSLGKPGARPRTLFLRTADGEILGSVEAPVSEMRCAAPVGPASFAVPDDAGVRFVAADGTTQHLDRVPGGYYDIAPAADGLGVWAAARVGDAAKQVWSIVRVAAPAEALPPRKDAPGQSK